jgi:hypothetical protein
LILVDKIEDYYGRREGDLTLPFGNGFWRVGQREAMDEWTSHGSKEVTEKEHIPD